MQSQNHDCRKRRISHRLCSGQALIEFALISLLLITFLFGLIDFSRALLVRQVLVNLSREGANLASRGTSFTDTLAAMVVSASPLVIDQKGFVILTTVSRTSSGVLVVADQQSRGGKSASSKVGVVGSTPNLPNQNIPTASQKSLVVAEVFYEFAPVTPIGTMLGSALPSKLYDVSYF